ncbi:MAG: hypothetical protein ABR985_11135 [Methanotrichaceae archaeon]
MISLVASANAMDVWSGSNNKVASGSGSVAGSNGFSLVDGASSVTASLDAIADIADGSAGIALSDWSVPTTTIARTKLENGNLHDLSVVIGGHVQTGLQKTSTYGEARAEARIYSTATETAGGPDTGEAYIVSGLEMNGKTSGYAIANGVAGFSTAQKQGSTSNDLFKAIGSVSGNVDIRGDTTASIDTVLTNGADMSHMSAIKQIYSRASAGTDGTALSDSFMGGHLGGMRTNQPAADQLGRANTTITVTNANANSAAWDGSSAAIKTLDNANALTAINNVNMKDKLVTWTEASTPCTTTDQDSATADQSITADSSVASSIASTGVGTAVTVGRQQTQTVSSRRVTSESFINGGSYKAVTRPNELDLLQASGTLGGTFPGVASGAHLWSARAADVLPFDSSKTLTQTARSIGTRTSAVLTASTNGPAFTGNSNDDAGSYFSAMDYTTLSKSSATLDTMSTTVANPWEINWVNGNQVSNYYYYNNFVSSYVGSMPATTITAVSLNTGEPRTTSDTFSLTQPYAVVMQ